MIKRVFSVKELIDSFDMDTFLTVQEDLNLDNAAVLLITDSQMILSYTGEHCRATHPDTIANILCEVKGKEKNVEEFDQIMNQANEKYIVGKFLNMFGLFYLIFDFYDLKKISPNQLELFRMFIDRYNERIQQFSKEVEAPTVIIGINHKEYSYENLELSNVLSFLESIVDADKELEEDSLILGETLEKHIK